MFLIRLKKLHIRSSFFYFTLIFFPARILLNLMPFSLRSFLTVVPWRAAISERVSPFLMVTLFVALFSVSASLAALLAA